MGVLQGIIDLGVEWHSHCFVENATMPARLPLLRKTPFHLDPRPLAECSSVHAGLLSASRALRSLQVPGAVEANVSIKQRARGLSEAQ